MAKIRLSKRKEKRSLTWFSRILILLVLFTGFLLIFKSLNGFLSLSKPVPSKALVVEGWMPDYVIKELVDYYEDHHYTRLYITGLPIEKGYYATEFKTFADITLYNLVHFGFDTSGVTIVTIPRSIRTDRTFTTALALKNYMLENYPEIRSLDVFTLGCHARRSRLLFRKAFGEDYDIGIISGKDKSYHMDKWWDSSRGFRTVTNEFLAWLYFRLFFTPDFQKTNKELESGYFLDELESHRMERDKKYSDPEQSPLTSEQIEHFSGLKYFEPDETFRVKAHFRIDTSGGIFKMKTTTDRLPEYRKYAILTFAIDTALYSLNAYQNIAYMNHEKYGNYLFVPFRDLSCGNGSYGGGRYIDLELREADSVILDFNYAYNPYCSYNARYSCPIPPRENFVAAEIHAGEKEYEKH